MLGIGAAPVDAGIAAISTGSVAAMGGLGSVGGPAGSPGAEIAASGISGQIVLAQEDDDEDPEEEWAEQKIAEEESEAVVRALLKDATHEQTVELQIYRKSGGFAAANQDFDRIVDEFGPAQPINQGNVGSFHPASQRRNHSCATNLK
jgi:hypothetical protein